MDFEIDGGRLFLRRTREQKQRLLVRLARIEGQVRGLSQMIDNDRYCGDELQQAAAITAALREVSLLVLTDHLDAGVEHAASARASDDGREAAESAVREMITLLRTALKQ